jgi:predicted nuclease of restriction endonuclease-like (RecB) superfamily
MSEPKPTPDSSFREITELIQSARQRAYRAVNTELVNLYWQVGQVINRRVAEEGWGKRTVKSLSEFIQKVHPGIRGFSAQNIWRMRQFYETYQTQEKLSAVLRDLPWTHHMLILGQAKMEEEREFYIRMAIREKWSSRELERQLKTGLFLRVVANPPKVSAALTQLHPLAEEVFKDAYSLEFLGLADTHDESDLHGALIRNLGHFLTELGRDFCFVGSEYPLQVGTQDFSLDLLLFHRGLNALVAIELKAGRFEPEHLGKLNFYLEALERDHRKPHENPPVGMLLCASKDEEVVEYALSRSLSPAMVAQYETQMPDKEMLKAKLHEFYQQLAPPAADGGAQ